jgi:hypothetical protein
MLIMFTDEQLFSPHLVCQNCLLADSQGQPRWQKGRLRCGHPICRPSEQQLQQYQCRMGFRVAEVANYTQEQ